MRTPIAFSVVTLLTSLVACGANTSPLVEEHEFTSGSYSGLTIGMNKAEAVSAAKILGAKFATPHPCRDFNVSKKNLNDLPTLEVLEGIRVTRASGIYADFYFIDGVASKGSSSPGADFASFANTGDGLEAVRQKLVALLTANPDLMAHAILRNQGNNTLSLDDESDSAQANFDRTTVGYSRRHRSSLLEQHTPSASNKAHCQGSSIDAPGSELNS